MRVSRVLLASFPLALTLAAPDPAKAQESCLPALKQDVISLDRASIVTLSVLDKKLQETQEDEKTGVLATYGEYKLDFDQSKVVKDKLETLLDVDYTESEKELIRSTTLPREAVDAYLGCLSSKNGIEIPAAISAGAVNSDSFFLTFYWDKKDRPENETATAKLMISQGWFRDSNSFNLNVPVADREGTVVRVVRNRYEPSEISIEIPGADPTIITVPKVPSRRVVTAPIQGEGYTYNVAESTGTFGRDICVYAPTDTVIVPNSFRVVYPNKSSAGVTYTAGPVIQDPFIACQNIGGSWATPFSSWAHLTAQSAAVILKWEPIAEATRSFQQPAPVAAGAPAVQAAN